VSHFAASAVKQLISDARVPGLSLAIVSDGQVITRIAAGVRNSRDRIAVDPQTVFAVASLSKPLFAYGVLRLVDAGKLALDAPLSQHVPDYVADDPRAATITIRHVLSHTSGLPNWRSAELPLKTYFAPGERFSYSGEGFVWLQYVVESVTGEDLDKTLRRLIFEPLGMNRSSYIWQSAFDTNYADPHDADEVSGTIIKPSVPNSAASLLTTAEDYALFLAAVLSRVGLERGNACDWFKPTVRLQDVQIAWGLGWGLEVDTSAFFQWGDYDRGRFKAFAMGSQQQACAIVVLTNGFHGMAIMPNLIGAVLSGPHPSFSWLGYPMLSGR
jgi:CubicO group peptidase (beta-lactamase class C family)